MIQNVHKALHDGPHAFVPVIDAWELGETILHTFRFRMTYQWHLGLDLTSYSILLDKANMQKFAHYELEKRVLVLQFSLRNMFKRP